ncbi:hypothetical protein OS493_003763 [Desmophyllum pertusum]|uniref:Uncharacterized protein n=1 Tax=Desmophyllum pertusum TaxID=174260 RepID=A0A9X0A660_9CNID|nr:hypothetical protein OS493_003763 [Desmophyllum pertusum]
MLLQTFTYDAEYWNNTVAYNKDGGTSLNDEETKLSSFWSTPFSRLCLGMKDELGETNWITLSYVGSSLRDVIGNGTSKATHLNPTEWTKLLRLAVNNSRIQVRCTFQGFNIRDGSIFDNGAKARIGIIGTPNTCDETAQSRIGFGTAGSYYGQTEGNSCGNEKKKELSIKAFGYIFVQ